jgi:diguanylate cyclase (GGDEF)-like protein/PAS domain S-box-containing protein
MMNTMLGFIKRAALMGRTPEKAEGHAAGLISDASLEANQLSLDRAETTVRVVPALMLSNVLLASLVFIARTASNSVDVTVIVYLLVCIVSLWVFVFFRNSNKIRRQTNIDKFKKKPSALAGTIAFLMGCFWAMVPPSIYIPSLSHDLVLSLMVIAGVLCVAGFMLTIMPALALPFLIPVLVSCYATTYMSGSPQSLLIAIGLTVYLTWIVIASLLDTRTKVRELVVKKTIQKQDKTISLLLRDFDNQSRHWLWEIGANGKFVRVSDSFKDVSGRSALELQNMTMAELICPVGVVSHLAEPLLQSVQNKNSFTDISIPVAIKGETFWWSMTGTPDFDESGTYRGFHGVGSDITQQKQSNERVEFLAHHDVLTGLYNRAHFTELLHQNVSKLERYGASFAVMFFDLDYFKSVNDTYGHPMGDKLLIEVAGRIRGLMPANAPVSRLGGDEFAVIFPDGLNSRELQSSANATLKAICTPFEIDGEKLQIGVSIGIALAPHHGTRPDQLLRNVDLALYRAKESGRNSFCVFEAGMDSAARERRALEFDLRYALEGNELELFYQPFVNAKNNQPIGFEALLRWNHPIRGQISPAEFIPIAEATGLIGPIGEWVIQKACTDAATWPDHLRIAVNLSALQFNKNRVVEIVTRSLAETGLRADRLELEITESLLIDQPEDAISKLKHLKNLGVSIAMDDFGTGYSSLSYMLKFPFDKIKVDKSFIASVGNEGAANDVLRTIALLGKSLKVKMTAEGVETLEQAEFLKELQFDQLQGFFYSKPLRASEVSALLLSMTSKALNQSYNKVVKLHSSAA